MTSPESRDELDYSQHTKWSFSMSEPIIGLYGLPESGKTFLLNLLRNELDGPRSLNQELFAFYEGSEVIDSVTPGGLEAFRGSEEHKKVTYRQLAINKIRNECKYSEKAAIVTGHYMFWDEKEAVGQSVWTSHDQAAFTSIVYLDTPVETIAQRRQDDVGRVRPSVSVEHLRKWQQVEKDSLRETCYAHGILYVSLLPNTRLSKCVSILVEHLRFYTTEENLNGAKSRMPVAVNFSSMPPETIENVKTMIVMDGDKTLALQDTGALFWKLVSYDRVGEQDPLVKLFSSPMGYSHTAFRQAKLLYEEMSSGEDFDALCTKVAMQVTVHPEFVLMLRMIAGQHSVGAVIITCGIGRVWEKVLEREGLSAYVSVIGSGRLDEGFVITPEVKAALVTYLQQDVHMQVWAFGDSVLDIDILVKASQAVVVVGDEQTRSKTMDKSLRDAIDNRNLRARQVLFPANVSPRLNVTDLPQLQLTEHAFLDSVFGRPPRNHTFDTELYVDEHAAKLLMTPMRDAMVTGPALREAHERVGWYLASNLGEAIGLETYSVQHVQGHSTNGYRLSMRSRH